MKESHKEHAIAAAAGVLMAVLAGGLEYLWTEGESGWVPLIAALIGGVVAYSAVYFLFPRLLKRFPRLLKRHPRNEATKVREHDELRCRFDEDPANGRIAARLISKCDLHEAKRVYEAYRHAEPKCVGRYCPECAMAAKFAEHDEPMLAGEVLSEAQHGAAFAQESARHYGQHPERASDLAAYEAALDEFYLNAGRDPDP